MSYSVQSTCWNCIKKVKCTDHVKIMEAIKEIHKDAASDESGHMGSGNIMHQCFKLVTKENPVTL